MPSPGYIPRRLTWADSSNGTGRYPRLGYALTPLQPTIPRLEPAIPGNQPMAAVLSQLEIICTAQPQSPKTTQHGSMTAPDRRTSQRELFIGPPQPSSRVQETAWRTTRMQGRGTSDIDPDREGLPSMGKDGAPRYYCAKSMACRDRGGWVRTGKCEKMFINRAAPFPRIVHAPGIPPLLR